MRSIRSTIRATVPVADTPAEFISAVRARPAGAYPGRDRDTRGRMTDATALRQWYADDLRVRAPVRRNMAIVEAFAAVPRERFLGPPPWRVLSDRCPGQPFQTTPD